jgi:hypothetical protein
MTKGDLVSWSTARFELANMTAETHPTSYVCIPPRPGHVLFPERRNLTTHHAFCRKLKGETSVVYDNATQAWMSRQILNYTASCAMSGSRRLGRLGEL